MLINNINTNKSNSNIINSTDTISILNKNKNSSGYTLVSVSFVLLAMSIVVTSILGFYDANNLNRRLKLTTDKFEIINTGSLVLPH